MDGRTIAAIATPQAAGGIGIIRISGENALTIAEKVFSPVSGASLSRSAGYRAYFGRVANEGKDIGEAICLVFRAPHSYTGEDVAEISLHGGLFVMQKALETVFSAGARPAEAGEFTKRAFLNGKLDLSGAEAVMSMIHAQNEQAARAAQNALDGALSREINAAAKEIIAVAANIAAWVDYPDDDIDDISGERLMEVFSKTKKMLEGLLSRFDSGQAITEGVPAAIAGRPNVGKSALMNLLTGYERSIVTPYAGTTRDVIEETVRVGNVVLRLSDTAGIHDTDDPVESVGIGFARKKQERASLIIAVFDGSEELTDGDLELLDFCSKRTSIAVINKTDIGQRLDVSLISSYIEKTVEISAATGDGLEELQEAVEHALGTDNFDPSSAMLATERQRGCCRRAVGYIDEAIAAVESGMTLDAVGVCADACIGALLELTGEKAGDAVINEVFASFCVGK
ncbi:MAG: tRNA uridine-5-carboxymethylaminomethyl(34) synthesis GTPase MnmE [Clostridiales bacterium]|jgi:tRNA modification GTPase|nr:tRNA uridine-5-carboxymethylaminomethyl(34) synthesis GTPase MnmE [Clostridiales bacterium]